MVTRWVTLAEGDVEQFQEAQPDLESLPHGTKIRVEIDVIPPLGLVADTWGQEWVGNLIYARSGAVITDVEGVGLDKVYIHMEANAVWLVPLILAIVAVIGIGGLAYLVYQIRLLALVSTDLVPWADWRKLAVIAGIAGLAAVPFIYLFTKRRSQPPGG